MSSIVNKNGFGGFRVMNIVKTNGNSLNVVPRKNTVVSKKRGLGLLGKGEYGKAYIGCINSNCKKQVAIKIQKDGGLDHEFKILKKVWDITPHVARPYLYKKCGKSEIMYSEYANGGDFDNLFDKYQDILTHKVLQTLTFQIIYTMYAIQKQYPTFRHLDLHTGNVFLDTNFPKTGGTKYDTEKDVAHNFRVPNIGIRVLIGDFGLASMKGLESKNVVNLRHKNKYGIGPDTNPFFDLHYFLSFLLEKTEKQKLPSTLGFRKFLKDVLPPEYRGVSSTKVSEGRLKYNVNHPKLPSIAKVLNNEYFRPFRIFTRNMPGHNITNRYPKKHNVNLFNAFQKKLKTLKIGKRSPVSPVAYKNKNKKPAIKKRVVVPRKLVNENVNVNKKKFLESLKRAVANANLKKVPSVVPKKVPAPKKKVVAPTTRFELKALKPPPPVPMISKDRIAELKAFVKNNGVEIVKSSAPAPTVVVTVSAAEKRRQLEKETYRIYEELKKKNKNAYNLKKAKDPNMDPWDPNLDQFLDNARTQAVREARVKK